MTSSSNALLSLDHISLSFKGVKAVTDISFAVHTGEICALIGPNGAGKSSLLNVINGVYQPQQGSVNFDGRIYRRMNPYHAAHSGIARTFQNIALFRRMSVLDNVLTGRNLHRRSTWFEQTLSIGRARRDETVTTPLCRSRDRSTRFAALPAYHRRHPAVRRAEARRTRPRARRRAAPLTARRTDGRHECRRKTCNGRLRARRQYAIWRDRRTHRARHLAW
jgi:ABC-type branched-chain amino acid transport systems, ATPase component